MTTALARSIVTMAPRFISEGFLWSPVCSRLAVVNAEVMMEGLLMVVLSSGERREVSRPSLDEGGMDE